MMYTLTYVGAVMVVVDETLTWVVVVVVVLE
jgi:hypothetical protein